MGPAPGKRRRSSGWDPPLPSPRPCYAIVLPGWKSGFRAACRRDSNRQNRKIGPLAGLRPSGGPILRHSRLVRPKSGPEDRYPARKHYCVTSGTYQSYGPPGPGNLPGTTARGRGRETGPHLHLPGAAFVSNFRELDSTSAVVRFRASPGLRQNRPKTILCVTH